MYTNEELIAIHNSKIGFEFEFYSNNKNIESVKESLTDSLNKKIVIEEKAHSDFKPTTDIFKLEPDNSGGTGLIELVTGPLPFNEAKIILGKTFKWIKENGNTKDTCSIHINLAFDTKRLGSKLNMSNLDIGKFVLSFNEKYVYELFPNRKKSYYARSIKYIKPLGNIIYETDDINWKNYKFVNDKYYGVNFTKIPDGYIEFRYIGGKNYEYKYNSVLSLTEHFLISLFRCLNKPKYNDKDKLELIKILDNHKKIIKAYRSYDNFKNIFKNIKITIDLKDHEHIIKSFYYKIRNKLYDLISESNLKKGLVNYDSDVGKLQVKDTKFDSPFLIKGIEIIDSNISTGKIINCDIFNSKIINSSIENSNLFGESVINNSKVKNSYTSRNVEINKSYVWGSLTIFSGIMKDGIFRQGRTTEHAEFNNTEIIEREKIK